ALSSAKDVRTATPILMNRRLVFGSFFMANFLSRFSALFSVERWFPALHRPGPYSRPDPGLDHRAPRLIHLDSSAASNLRRGSPGWGFGPPPRLVATFSGRARTPRTGASAASHSDRERRRSDLRRQNSHLPGHRPRSVRRG